MDIKREIKILDVDENRAPSTQIRNIVYGQALDQ